MNDLRMIGAVFHLDVVNLSIEMRWPSIFVAVWTRKDTTGVSVPLPLTASPDLIRQSAHGTASSHHGPTRPNGLQLLSTMQPRSDTVPVSMSSLCCSAVVLSQTTSGHYVLHLVLARLREPVSEAKRRMCLS